MPPPEEIAASSKSAVKQSLQNLQSKMKRDPESYESELELTYRQFNSSLELFQRQADTSFISHSGIRVDPTVAKYLGECAMFLAHMTPFFKHLSVFPNQLVDLLGTKASSMPSSLRCQIVKALILLSNGNNVAISETLPLFMKLQTLGDKVVRELAYSHVICFIQRMNKKHKDELKNKPLQNLLFQMLQCEDESIAKRSLITLCDLYSRKVWCDDRTANNICWACFHPSSRIMIAALSFLLDYEKIKDDDDSYASSSEDEANIPHALVVLSKEDVHKANHKGTTSSKKKKKAKLQRVMRSMKKKQRLTSEKASPNYYSPLTKLIDAQEFAEKLLSRYQSCNERIEVKMMMLKVVARTIGLYKLILRKFYPCLQKYVQPHVRDVTKLLAATIQACHDVVPPDAVEPLFKQVANQFVHDHSPTEAITVGLNVLREISQRMPLMMNEELLQDLVKYKKSNKKEVSSASRSLITLFRELCPSLLLKKDRGRPTNPKARPKAYGEVNVASNVPGAELLQQPDEDVDVASDLESDGLSNIKEIDSDDDDAPANVSDGYSMAYSDSTFEDSEGAEDVDKDGEVSDVELGDEEELYSGSDSDDDDDDENTETDPKREARKRKFANTSLRALKKQAVDHIYSNEDFQLIKELQAKEKARTALTRHGLLKGSCSKSVAVKIPSSDQLSLKPIDPSTLEAHIRRKMTKEQRVALMKAGRQDRWEYKSKTAVKQKKKGGSSNREKEHKKMMPWVAKRSKLAKSKIDKKRKHSIAAKQFRGRKAWK